MPFKKGDPIINRKGRPKKGETVTDLLREFLETEKIGEKKIQAKKALIQKTFQLAMQGDLEALKYLWNRMDGTPKQAVELSGDSENPIENHLVVEFVKSKE